MDQAALQAGVPRIEFVRKGLRFEGSLSRFVAGFSGEQFALPEAMGMLRATRRQEATDHWVSVSGADPLNLVGIPTPAAKLPALAGNRLLYRDGFPRPYWQRVIFSFWKLLTM